MLFLCPLHISGMHPASSPTVIAVSRSGGHTFSKTTQSSIRLIGGLGVESDAHLGPTVKHRSRVARDPSQPNLRQVHLIHAELHDELAAAGFVVAAGEMGENVTTRGVDLLTLPRGTRLHLGPEAIVGSPFSATLRGIDRFQPVLAVRRRDASDKSVRKTGVMST